MATEPSNTMTADRVKRIYKELQLKRYHQHQIAAIEGVNQGRISEVKSGKYDYLLQNQVRQQTLI